MKSIMFWAKYPTGVKRAFESLGYKIVEFDEYDVLKDDEQKTNWIVSNTDKIEIDLFFSFNFVVGISKWCHDKGIIYISWSVDSPHLSLYSDMIKYDTNRIW